MVHWNNLRPDQVHEYTKCTNIELSQFIVPDGVRCRDPNCKSRIHQADISEFHDSITGSLTACSQPLTAPNNRAIKLAIVPGWNEYVKEHHDVPWMLIGFGVRWVSRGMERFYPDEIV